MPDMEKYDNLAVSKKTSKMIREEAKKSRRAIYVEAEILIEEAVEARKVSVKKK